MKQEKAMIIHKLETDSGEIKVSQRPGDGYIHLNPMAKASGKFIGHWLENTDTKEFLHALSMDIGIPISMLVIVFKGKPANKQGTWAHIQVALKFAAWCNKRFEVQVFKWLEKWMKGEIGLDLNSRAMIRMLLHPTSVPWKKTFPNDFYHELARLYGLKYEPEKGAPGGMHAANLTDKLIYSRFHPEIREELKSRNPVVTEDFRREAKHFQYFKGDLAAELDSVIHLCTLIMRRFARREAFEVAWDMVRPRAEQHQMLLIPDAFLPDEN